MKFEDIIPRIVSGFAMDQGDIVLIQLWGEDESRDVLQKFALEIGKQGGCPIQWQYSWAYLQDYFSSVPDRYLDFPNAFFDIFKPVTVVIDLITQPLTPPADFPPAKLPFFGQFMQRLFQTLTQEAIKYFIQIRVPTKRNAAQAGIDYELFENTVLKALDVDYTSIKENCDKIVQFVSGLQNIKIFSEEDRVLSLSVGDRPWHKDDGTGDIPCGEVYISPLEQSAEGEILIPDLFLAGQKYSNVVLRFQKGTLVHSSEPAVLEYIRPHSGDKDRIAEFGIGLNPGVETMIGYPSTDEKCYGSAHIAVGMNKMVGGENVSSLHLDFVFHPLKIEMDGSTILDTKGIVTLA